MKYGMYYGPLKPILATDKMTMDVGQRLGKLYTYDENSILPEVTETDNDRVLAIENSEWIASNQFKGLFSLIYFVFNICNGYKTITESAVLGIRDIIGGSENV